MSWGNCTSGVHQYVKHVNLDLLGWTVYCSPDLKIEASSAGARLPSKWQWFLHHIWWACKRGQANGKVCWLCRLPTWLVFLLHKLHACIHVGQAELFTNTKSVGISTPNTDWVVFSLQCFNRRLSSLAPQPAFMPLDVKQVGVEMVVDSGRGRFEDGRLSGVGSSEDVGAFWIHPVCGDRSKLIETWSIERLTVAILSASFFAGACPALNPHEIPRKFWNYPRTWEKLVNERVSDMILHHCNWSTVVGFLQSDIILHPCRRNTRHGHWAGIDISYSRMLPVILFWGPALGVAGLARVKPLSWRAPFPLKLGVFSRLYSIYIYIYGGFQK